ncbi:helix-turn-helix domain-containing protein [uncultured Psychroserpens sp.]|uniref:helix-turn-helix domain-containing protein n=1 Tax=uncultured Psychroserpens sp. TaxID=255436 RepID=UPI002603F72D|nr:helix-turn-helix domain-containing protein [uncultured Psychroserpens sp.]
MKELNTLKEFRKAKNYTQEELAKQSGISIRTIQRIEKGLTKGSPHTLKALAKTLDVESSDIIVLADENNTANNDSRKLKLMNFSILSVLLIPFGNIILPTIFFLLHKSNTHVNSIGRRILSIQIISTFLLCGIAISLFFIIGRGGGAIPLPVPIIYFMYTSVNIIIVIHTSIAIDKNEQILKFFPNIV